MGCEAQKKLSASLVHDDAVGYIQQRSNKEIDVCILSEPSADNFCDNCPKKSLGTPQYRQDIAKLIDMSTEPELTRAPKRAFAAKPGLPRGGLMPQSATVVEKSLLESPVGPTMSDATRAKTDSLFDQLLREAINTTHREQEAPESAADKPNDNV